MNTDQRLAEVEPIISRAVTRVAHGHDDHAREDAMQEARIKVWLKIESDPDVSDGIIGYTARLAAIDLLVNKRRPAGAPSDGTQRHYEQAATVDLTTVTDAAESRAVEGRAPKMPRALTVPDETDAIDLRVLVEPILATLSERDRQLVHLLYWEDKTHAEAATALDLTREHVSRLLNRTILPTLRAALG